MNFWTVFKQPFEEVYFHQFGNILPKIGGKIFWIKTNLHFELCGPMIVLWQESPPGRFYNTQSYSKSEQVRGGLVARKSTLGWFSCRSTGSSCGWAWVGRWRKWMRWSSPSWGKLRLLEKWNKGRTPKTTLVFSPLHFSGDFNPNNLRWSSIATLWQCTKQNKRHFRTLLRLKNIFWTW